MEERGIHEGQAFNGFNAIPTQIDQGQFCQFDVGNLFQNKGILTVN